MTGRIILQTDDVDDPPVDVRVILLAVAAGLVTLVLALYARSVAPDPTNVPMISADARPYYLLSILATASLGVAVQRVSRPLTVGRLDVVEPKYRGIRSPLPTASILPSLTMLGVLLLVAHEPYVAIVAAAPVLVGTGVFAAMLVHRELFATNGLSFTSARVAHLTLTYVVAALLLTVVFLFKARTLYLAPTVFLATFLLLVQVHDGVRALPARIVVYAIAGGIILAEVAWGLSYWPASGWYGGFLLAALLIVLGHVTYSHLIGRLSGQVALRSGGVTAGVVILAACIS